MTISVMNPSKQLSKNLKYIKTNAPDLYLWLSVEANQNDVRLVSSHQDYELWIGEYRMLEMMRREILSAFLSELRQPDTLAIAAVSNTLASTMSPAEILCETIDSHQPVLIRHLSNLFSEESASSPQYSCSYTYKYLCLLGSLALIPLQEALENEDQVPWISITLADDNPAQFYAALFFVDLESLVAKLREKGIGFSLICEKNYDTMQERLINQFCVADPCSLYGLQFVRSPLRTPYLSELHAWIHSEEGLQQHVMGSIGFATDELNQVQQSAWTYLSVSDVKLVKQNIINSHKAVVLIASGPSLDDHLTWLRDHQDKLAIIASASSLGTLLRFGIYPVAVTYLERGSEVYHQLLDIISEGYDLTSIWLLASSTLDPRVYSFFNNVAQFHRPSAAATRLFSDENFAVLPQAGPHVINASLEVLSILGLRRFLAVGCDFGSPDLFKTRSYNALGDSPRNLSIPILSNKMNTVFSDPELLYTHNLFVRIIKLFPDIEIRRLGEGVDISTAINVNTEDALCDWDWLQSDELRASLSSLPFARRDKEHLADKITRFEEKTMFLISEIKKLLHESPPFWSSSLSRSLSDLFVRAKASPSSTSEQFAKSLLMHPIYFLLRPLYISDRYHWSEEVTKASTSLDQLAKIYAIFYALLKRFLIFAQFPGWDPSWIKRMMLLLSDSDSHQSITHH